MMEYGGVCRQARGSLFELVDHLTVALDEKYMNTDEFDSLKAKCYNLIKKLNSLKYLKFKRRKQNDYTTTHYTTTLLYYYTKNRDAFSNQKN